MSKQSVIVVFLTMFKIHSFFDKKCFAFYFSLAATLCVLQQPATAGDPNKPEHTPCAPPKTHETPALALQSPTLPPPVMQNATPAPETAQVFDAAREEEGQATKKRRLTQSATNITKPEQTSDASALEQKAPILQLPNDMLWHILSFLCLKEKKEYLSADHLVLRKESMDLRLVCKRFYELMMHKQGPARFGRFVLKTPQDITDFITPFITPFCTWHPMNVFCHGIIIKDDAAEHLVAPSPENEALCKTHLSALAVYKGLPSKKISIEHLDDYVIEYDWPKLSSLPITRLSVRYCANYKNLANFKELEALRISLGQEHSIKWLTGLPQLKDLDLAEGALADLSPLSHLINLECLWLDNMQSFENTDFLAPLTQLKKLSIVSCFDLKHITNLKECKNLRYVELVENHELAEMGDLAACASSVEILHLGWINTEPLRAFQKLKRLYLYGNRDISLEPVTHLENLQELDIGRCENYLQILPLLESRNLKKIAITDDQLAAQDPLSALDQLAPQIFCKALLAAEHVRVIVKSPRIWNGPNIFSDAATHTIPFASGEIWEIIADDAEAQRIYLQVLRYNQ